MAISVNCLNLFIRNPVFSVVWWVVVNTRIKNESLSQRRRSHLQAEMRAVANSEPFVSATGNQTRIYSCQIHPKLTPNPKEKALNCWTFHQVSTKHNLYSHFQHSLHSVKLWIASPTFSLGVVLDFLLGFLCSVPLAFYQWTMYFKTQLLIFCSAWRISSPSKSWKCSNCKSPNIVYARNYFYIHNPERPK